VSVHHFCAHPSSNGRLFFKAEGFGLVEEEKGEEREKLRNKPTIPRILTSKRNTF
jgi:hypothetical protein